MDRVDVLAVPGCRHWPAASPAARVVSRRGARGAPRVEAATVLVGADAGAGAFAVELPLERVVIGPGLEPAAAAVLGVRVGAALDPAVAALAAQRAADRHPQAGLPDVAHGRAVPAGAGVVVVAVALPLRRALAAAPLREVAVDGVAGLPAPHNKQWYRLCYYSTLELGERIRIVLLSSAHRYSLLCRGTAEREAAGARVNEVAVRRRGGGERGEDEGLHVGVLGGGRSPAAGPAARRARRTGTAAV